MKNEDTVVKGKALHQHRLLGLHFLNRDLRGELAELRVALRGSDRKVRRPVKSEINRENAAYILRKPDAELLSACFTSSGSRSNCGLKKYL